MMRSLYKLVWASASVGYLAVVWTGHQNVLRAMEVVEKSTMTPDDSSSVVLHSLDKQPLKDERRVLHVTSSSSAVRSPVPTAAVSAKRKRQKQRRTRKDYPFLWMRKLNIRPGDNRPPLTSLIGSSGEVVGSVQSLLHYAVIGFGKAGTTSMMNWLNSHPELQTYPREIYDLMKGDVSTFVQRLYTLPKGFYKRGYKSPADLGSVRAMKSIQRYFPETKLIVGLRHPVRWFESLYNFRLQNLGKHKDHESFPKPLDLIGSCSVRTRNTCTAKGEFALHLRNLGKTLTTHNQRDSVTGKWLLTDFEKSMYKAAGFDPVRTVEAPLPNPVFIFEINQLSDSNATRAEAFRHDVETYLELQSPLADMIHHKPGKIWAEEELQALKDKLKINICDDEHIPVRQELMRISRLSSVWIREYLLDPETMTSSKTFVSSREHFIKLVADWMIDPCEFDEPTKEVGWDILEAAGYPRNRWDLQVDEQKLVEQQ